MIQGVSDWQLGEFNRLWPEVCGRIPYFQRLQKEKKLPRKFSSWQDFSERVPLMERKDLQENHSLLVSSRGKPDYWRMTGGSTGEPLQIPAWNLEKELAREDLWQARSWFGVERRDKLFLIWGHSHLFGKGIQRYWNQSIRFLKDRWLGYRRYSAYDLSEEGLRRAAQSLLHFRPVYILGYAAALDRFARINQDLASEFHKLRLKVVIATAESFPRPESAEVVSEVLGSPVAMEYGAVETGPMAHQDPSGVYRVFWKHFFLEAIPSPEVTGAYELLVTTLYPCYFPLVRYRIGDLIFKCENPDSFPQEFRSIIGRSNDLVRLKDGNVIHSEAFAHALRDFSQILGYQVRQENGEIRIAYLAKEPLGVTEVREIHRRLSRVHPSLNSTPLERAESLSQTLAGKITRICATA